MIKDELSLTRGTEVGWAAPTKAINILTDDYIVYSGHITVSSLLQHNYNSAVVKKKKKGIVQQF